MTGLIPFNRKHDDLMNVGFDDFSNVLDDFFTSGWQIPRSLAGDTFKIDIQENDKEYTVEAEIPGVKKEDIDMTLNDGKLTISVEKEEVSESKDKKYIHRERKHSQMARSIMLVDADEEGIEAKLEKGVLTVTISKKEEEDHSKHILIE